MKLCISYGNHCPCMYILLQTFVANNVEFSIVFLHVVYADAKIVRLFWSQCILQRLIHIRLDTCLQFVFFRAITGCHLECFLEVGANSLWSKIRVRKEPKRITNERTSIEKSSKGAASTALIVSLLLGCTVANPPETVPEMIRWLTSWEFTVTHQRISWTRSQIR